jgi:hypothetical protein
VPYPQKTHEYEAYLKVADLYCIECNTLVCSKCQTTNHIEHNEDNIIVDIKTYIDEAVIQMELFKEKFSKFIDMSSSHTPIDETIYDLLDKQKGIIDLLYDDHRRFIKERFDTFIKKMELIRELEYNNLDNFRNFYKGKIEDIEIKLTDLLDVKNDVEDFVNGRLHDLNTFGEYDAFTREAIIKRVNDDMEVLRAKKQTIMNQFKEYQIYLKEIDKIKRYFQRTLLNLKENKTYDLTRVLDKLYNQLDEKFTDLNLHEYFDNVIAELDEYALLNSRNNAPAGVKDLQVACFKTKKILSYSIPDSTLSLIDCDFDDLGGLSHFLDFSRSININGKLYVNGGIEDTKKSSKAHLKYEMNQITRESDMIYSHSAHSLIFVPPQWLYCISGSGSKKCERYNITANSWQEIAELNNERQNASLAYQNEQYLYIFGGLSWNDGIQDFTFIETVERIDIGINNARWELVPVVKSQDNIDLCKSVMTVIPISSDKILLVGGMYKDQTTSDEVLLFDFETHEFSLLDDLSLEKPTCFPSRYFLFFDDIGYQFDNEGEIHQFSPKDLTFRIVSNVESD